MNQKKDQVEKTILIIEDDYFLIKFMEVALRKNGYFVLTASHGKQAINILLQQKVDMIVVDLMMPEMDGLVFLNWLRGEAELKTPTLVQTGMVKPDTEKKVMQAGANAVIFKPVKYDSFISKIQELETLL